jgi:hypothetical protein
MLETITKRTIRQETKRPTVDVVARQLSGQMKTIGGELRAKVSLPSRITLGGD